MKYLLNNACYDNCPIYYYNSLNYQCAGCITGCLTCPDGNTCTTCDTANNYQLYSSSSTNNICITSSTCFRLAPLAQHPTSQQNVGFVSAHTSSKELFASNSVTQDIMQTPTMCVNNVLTLAKSALVLLLLVQLAQIQR